MHLNLAGIRYELNLNDKQWQTKNFSSSSNMAAVYAVYHGPEGLKSIEQQVHGLAGAFSLGLKKLGTGEVQGLPFFDTVKVKVADAHAIADAAYKSEINLRIVDRNTVSVIL